MSFVNGTEAAVAASIAVSANQAVNTAISLIGIMTLWLGIMRIAECAGFIALFAKLVAPVMEKLFPEVPTDHPAMGAMILNIAANMLGLNNAATPFGLRAMEELDKLNQHRGIASDAMCTFLALNTSSVQLIPMTAIAILAANGDSAASDIVVPVLIATTCSTIVGIVIVKWLAKRKLFRIEPAGTNDAA